MRPYIVPSMLPLGYFISHNLKILAHIALGIKFSRQGFDTFFKILPTVDTDIIIFFGSRAWILYFYQAGYFLRIFTTSATASCAVAGFLERRGR